MSDRWKQDDLLHRSTRAASVIFVAAWLAGSAWAQGRDNSGSPPMRVPSVSVPRTAPAMRQAPKPRSISPLASTFASTPIPTLAPNPVPPLSAIHAAVPGLPSFLQRPLHSPAVLPKPAVPGKLYCSTLSALYNTGSICFNHDLFTIHPSFIPIEPYVPPPVLNSGGGSISSVISPALLLQYCAVCATQNAGLPPPNSVGGVKQPPLPAAVTPSGPPVILVLRNGTMPLVGRYWLGSDWLIHYVTPGGLPGAVPPGMLDLKATAGIHFQRGDIFSLPGRPHR